MTSLAEVLSAIQSVGNTVSEQGAAISLLQSAYRVGNKEPASEQESLDVVGKNPQDITKAELARLITARIVAGLPYADLAGCVEEPELMTEAQHALWKEELHEDTIREGRRAAKAERKAAKRARKAARRAQVQSTVAIGKAVAPPPSTRLGVARTRREIVNPERGGTRALNPSNNLHIVRTDEQMVITIELGERVAYALQNGTYSDRRTGEKTDWSAKNYATSRDGRSTWLDIGPYRLLLNLRKHYGTSDVYAPGSEPTIAAPDQSKII